MSLARLRAGMLLLVGFVGCAVGPNYRRSDLHVPALWSEPPPAGVTTQPPPIAQWWRTFQDAELDVLVGRAVRANLGLRQAEARVREAHALRGVAAADLWPTITVSGAYARTRLSENVSPAQAGPVDGGAAPGGARSGKLQSHLFQAGFDASWEIDLFGGVRRAIEAADADLAAAVEDYRAVLVSLLAEVARNYVEVRGLQRRLAIVRRTIQSQ